MRGIGGTITGRELAGYYSSGEATFGSILMATGDGNCFWVDALPLFDSIFGGDADDEFEDVIYGGSASDEFESVVSGGGA